jgi:hypothetical protein
MSSSGSSASEDNEASRENDKSTPSPKRDRKEFRLDNKLDLITDSEKNSKNFTEGFKFKIL